MNQNTVEVDFVVGAAFMAVRLWQFNTGKRHNLLLSNTSTNLQWPAKFNKHTLDDLATLPRRIDYHIED